MISNWAAPMIASTSQRFALSSLTRNLWRFSGVISAYDRNSVPKPYIIKETRMSPTLRQANRRYVAAGPNRRRRPSAVSRYEKPQANRKLGMIVSA